MWWRDKWTVESPAPMDRSALYSLQLKLRGHGRRDRNILTAKIQQIKKRKKFSVKVLLSNGCTNKTWTTTPTNAKERLSWPQPEWPLDSFLLTSFLSTFPLSVVFTSCNTSQSPSFPHPFLFAHFPCKLPTTQNKIKPKRKTESKNK